VYERHHAGKNGGNISVLAQRARDDRAGAVRRAVGKRRLPVHHEIPRSLIEDRAAAVLSRRALRKRVNLRGHLRDATIVPRVGLRLDDG
jgi:hypothetical protein